MTHHFSLVAILMMEMMSMLTPLGMDTNDCDGHVGANEDFETAIRHNNGGELYHQVIT